MKQKPGIFLSHSHLDKPFVRRLAQDLEGFGVRVWVDEAEMLVGDSLIQKIRQGIDEMDYVGAVISQNSIKSKWVQYELDAAMTQEVKGLRIKVLPLLLDECELPGFLVGKLYADFRQEGNYAVALRQILKRCEIEVETANTKRRVIEPELHFLEMLMQLRRLGRNLNEAGNPETFVNQLVLITEFLRAWPDAPVHDLSLISFVDSYNKIVALRTAMLSDPGNPSHTKSVREPLESIMGSANQLIVNSLCQRLRNSSTSIREDAARKLGQLGPAAASGVNALRKALKDSSGKVRTAAVWALSAIGTEEAKGAVSEYEKQ